MTLFTRIETSDMNIGAANFEIGSIRLMEALRAWSDGFDVGVTTVGTCFLPSASPMPVLNSVLCYLPNPSP